MKLVCIIQRAGGTKVPMADTTYHFKPESDAPGAPHVAEVEDDEHLAKFLAIPEGYRIHRDGPAAAPKPTSTPKPTVAPTPAPSATPAPTPAPPVKLVIKNDRESVDLGTMSKKSILAFCRRNELADDGDGELELADLRQAVFKRATAE